MRVSISRYEAIVLSSDSDYCDLSGNVGIVLVEGTVSEDEPSIFSVYIPVLTFGHVI